LILGPGEEIVKACEFLAEHGGDIAPLQPHRTHKTSPAKY
jgi:hypothetical protein